MRLHPCSMWSHCVHDHLWMCFDDQIPSVIAHLHQYFDVVKHSPIQSPQKMLKPYVKRVNIYFPSCD